LEDGWRISKAERSISCLRLHEDAATQDTVSATGSAGAQPTFFSEGLFCKPRRTSDKFGKRLKIAGTTAAKEGDTLLH
jgi:hypothetical protein